MRPDINAIEERRKRLYKSDADNVYVEDYLADTEFLLNRINDLATQLAESKAGYEAAVEDINKHIHNSTCCKNFKTPERRPGGGCVNSTGSGCSYCTNWTYRGRNKGNG